MIDQIIKEAKEKLAELEHEQWMAWSKNLVANMDIPPERLARWKTLWVAYDQLNDNEKDQDREWARKVIPILKSACERVREESEKSCQQSLAQMNDAYNQAKQEFELSVPMGVSQWREHGKKYGYWEFFEKEVLNGK